MGFVDFFRRKGGREAGKRLTLAELVEKLKTEGFTEEAIRDQLLKSFGKEQLKSFGEGVTISPEKVNEIVREIGRPQDHDPERA
ncbi:MAG: hypothetical protein ACE5LH_02215 [Fidelibacterota bacterium]